MNWKEWKFQALTDLWTGDAQGKPERLIPTGIMGSLRWWFEVLVRGLGGETCDPTAKDVRCPQASENAESGPRCVVCELFGCTGWARKFRLMILDEDACVIQGQINANTLFTLRFIPLRPIRNEEWCLLDATLRLIANYGAIGGKTVFKPSEEWGIADLGAGDVEERNGQVGVRHSRKGLPLQEDDVILEVEGSPISTLADLESVVARQKHGTPIQVKIERNGQTKSIKAWAGKRYHQDFGLVTLSERPNDLPTCSREQLKHYVQKERWRKNIPSQYQEDNHSYDYSWASLQNFWCVKGRYLGRQSFNDSDFNRVLGRREQKKQAQKIWKDTEINRWLAGRQQESKKVFSFKEQERTFGFVKPGLVDVEEMKKRLKLVWSEFDPDKEFVAGEHILKQLLQEEKAA